MCLVALPCVPVVKIRDGEGWVYSASYLKQIGWALPHYHESYGKLPPAVVTDKQGRPLYSWRVPLLPFLEQPTLYNEFKLDEPWDGPHNKALLAKMPACYMPAWKDVGPSYATPYQVFVGPGTAFERPGLSWADFPDRRADPSRMGTRMRLSYPTGRPSEKYDASPTFRALVGDSHASLLGMRGSCGARCRWPKRWSD
jgi:hypothetical protein